MADERMQKAQEQFTGFAQGFRSVVLSTVDAKGRPTTSYIPCVHDESGRIVGFVSRMAEHTANLERPESLVSAFFVEDESQADEIFARRRLTYDCTSEVLERDHVDFAGLVERFVERFGATGKQITSMQDFRPVRLTPTSGRFVIGFGAAYAVEGDTLRHLTGGGAGHGHGHGGGGGHGHGGHGHGHGGARGDGGHGGHGHGAADAGVEVSSDVAARIIEHMNGDHAEALLLYAQVFAQLADAQDASLESLDLEGLDLRVQLTSGKERSVRIPFDEPLSDSGALHMELREMVGRARALAQEKPSTAS